MVGKVFTVLLVSLLSLAVSRTSFNLKTPVHYKGNCYEYWCTGNCKLDKPKNNADTKPGTVLMGGGTDVDDAFRWMIDLSNNGDFVVLRATGTEAYNDYIYHLGHSASVSTLLISCREGSSEAFVQNVLQSADAVFFAGGDQWKYVQYWNGTRVSQIVNQRKEMIPIGGTSAGCDIQGNFIYTGENDTVSSKDALLNPYHYQVTVRPGMFTNRSWAPTLLLPDTHFFQRDRMGRVIVFLARILQDQAPSIDVIHGVAVDEQTAVLVADDGTSKLVSQASGPAHVAYFLRLHRRDLIQCSPGVPLSVSRVEVIRATPYKSIVDLKEWTGSSVDTYILQVDKGDLTTSKGSHDVY